MRWHSRPLLASVSSKSPTWTRICRSVSKKQMERKINSRRSTPTTDMNVVGTESGLAFHYDKYCNYIQANLKKCTKICTYLQKNEEMGSRSSAGTINVECQIGIYLWMLSSAQYKDAMVFLTSAWRSCRSRSLELRFYEWKTSTFNFLVSWSPECRNTKDFQFKVELKGH